MNPEARNAMDHDAELLASAESVPYKQLDEHTHLTAHVFFPPGERAGQSRPAILFFYGSGFDTGSPTQFAPHALNFSSRGAVSILIDYRTRHTHQASPLDAMRDARSAVRWARFYSTQLGIDPARVVVAGALAGGCIAAAAAMKPDLSDDRTDPAEVDGRPNAALLYSPLLEIGKGGYGSAAFAETDTPLSEAALARFIGKGLPPMLIIHGVEDRITPIETVEKFAHRMRKKKNDCRLLPFDGRQHSFYNLNVDPVAYDACNAEVDHFLVETGFLDPAPEITDGDLGEVQELK